MVARFPESDAIIPRRTSDLARTSWRRNRNRRRECNCPEAAATIPRRPACGLIGFGTVHGARFQDLPPFLDALLDASRQLRSCLAIEHRNQRAQGLRAVADEVHLHRIANARAFSGRCRSALRVPGLPLAGIRSTGKLEPTMSSVSHSFIMSQLGLLPSRPIEPVQNGSSSGMTALPNNALATPAPRMSATSITSSVALQCAGADQHRDFFARVKNFSRLPQILFLRYNPR